MPDLLAIDDTIWVEHGDYLENEVFPSEPSHGVTADQELQGPLHHPASIALSWVNSTVITWYGRCPAERKRKHTRRKLNLNTVSISIKTISREASFTPDWHKALNRLIVSNTPNLVFIHFPSASIVSKTRESIKTKLKAVIQTVSTSWHQNKP